MKHIRSLFVLVLCATLSTCGGGNAGNSGSGGGTPTSTSIKFIQAGSCSLNTEYGGTCSESTSAYTVAFKNTVAPDDMIVVAFQAILSASSAIGSSSVSVKDSEGNSYSEALAIPEATNAGIWIYYAPKVIGGSPTSVTVNVDLDQTSTEPGGIIIFALEYSGLTALDAVSINSGTTSLNNYSISSGDAVTHEANELIIGVGESGNDVITVGSGFTLRAALQDLIVEDEIVSSAGTYDAAFSVPSASVDWDAGMATFY